MAHMAHVSVFAILDYKGSLNGKKMQCGSWKKSVFWTKWPLDMYVFDLL